MAKGTDELILQRLEQILRVLSIQVAADRSLTERAKLLKMAGLENQVIADVLNISVPSVRTLTSKFRDKVGGENAMKDDSERIERLLVLLLLEAMKNSSQKEKAWKLNQAGFSNIDISELLDTSPAVIATYIYSRKKKKLKRNNSQIQ